MKKLFAQVMKFGVVGAIAFAIDYGLLIFLTEVFHIDYLASATVSFVVSVVFNYLASMRYVFSRREGMSRRREFLVFVALSVVGLALNDLLMWLGVDILAVDYRVTKLAATAIVMAWNFITRKVFLDGGDKAEAGKGTGAEAGKGTGAGARTEAGKGTGAEARVEAEAEARIEAEAGAGTCNTEPEQQAASPAHRVPTALQAGTGNAATKGTAPLISLVVPVYNVEAYLAQCLESIAAQTMPGWEAVCVNDGSTDGSRAIVARYALKDARFRIIDKKNGGLSSARNCGIGSAQAPLVWFVDSDDFIEPHACERIVQAFERTGADVVTFGAQCFPASEATPWLCERLSPRDKVYEAFKPDLLFKEMSHPYAWRTACRRGFLVEKGILFDEALRFGEDQLFHFAVYPRASKTALLSDKLYGYRLAREGSLMHRMEQDPAQKMSAHLDIVRKVFADWEQGGFLGTYASEAIAWTVEFVAYGSVCLGNPERDRLIDGLVGIWLEHFDAEGLLALSLPRATAAYLRAALEDHRAFDGLNGKRLRLAYYVQHFGFKAFINRLFGRYATGRQQGGQGM